MKPIKPSNSLDPKPLRSFLSERRGSNMTSDNQKKRKKSSTLEVDELNS